MSGTHSLVTNIWSSWARVTQTVSRRVKRQTITKPRTSLRRMFPTPESPGHF